MVQSCQSRLKSATATAANGQPQIHSHRHPVWHSHLQAQRSDRGTTTLHSKPRGLSISSAGCIQPSQPREAVLLLSKCVSGEKPGANLLCKPTGAAVRPELVPGLDRHPEREFHAGPPGESCAWESVHPPRVTEYTSGTFNTAPA